MLERRKQELEMVRNAFGEIEISPQFDFFVVVHFPLPPGYNKNETRLLVKIPSGYPITPPDNFYADNDLRLANGNLPGSSAPNENVEGKQWLRFSFHIESGEWKTNSEILTSHNLLTYMMLIKKRLSEVN